MRDLWDAVACLLWALLDGTWDEGGGVIEDGIIEAAEARRLSLSCVLKDSAGWAGEAGASVEGRLGSDRAVEAATLLTAVVSCGVVG